MRIRSSPGGSTLRVLKSPPYVSQGKVLFLGEDQAGAVHLIEYFQGDLKTIVRTGDSVAGSMGGFRAFVYGFAYAGDGSILFSAIGPGQKDGIYRWRDGVITPELTSLNTVAGRTIRYARLDAAFGNEYLVQLSFDGSTFGLYTTIKPEGTQPVQRPTLNLNRTDVGMTLSWPPGSVLEATSSLGTWNVEATVPSARVRFDLAPMRFFRLRAPIP